MRQDFTHALAYVLFAFLGVSLAMVQAQDAKFAKTYTPIGWKKLALTKEQTVKISEIHEKAKAKIFELQKHIDGIKVQERADQIKLLTDAQKATLRKLSGVDEPSSSPKE